MSLRQNIEADFKAAFRSGEKERMGVLRLVMSSIKNTEIEKLKREDGLNDEEVVELIARSIKQRRESIDQFQKGNRPELAAKEQGEIDILSAYMPEQLSDDELGKIVSEIIQSSGASSVGDMGKVMGQVMSRVKGMADGNAVRRIVEEKLKGI